MIRTSAIRPVDRVLEHAKNTVGEPLPILFVFFVLCVGLSHWATLPLIGRLRSAIQLPDPGGKKRREGAPQRIRGQDYAADWVAPALPAE